MPYPDTCVHWCMWSLGTEMQGLEDGPREKTGVGCMETVWMVWIVVQLQLGCMERSRSAIEIVRNFRCSQWGGGGAHHNNIFSHLLSTTIRQQGTASVKCRSMHTSHCFSRLQEQDQAAATVGSERKGQ